jgi:hypothetical protein
MIYFPSFVISSSQAFSIESLTPTPLPRERGKALNIKEVSSPFSPGRRGWGMRRQDEKGLGINHTNPEFRGNKHSIKYNFLTLGTLFFDESAIFHSQEARKGKK